ncbi:MAG: carboxypeptidase-like regulatory domain-containing protein, partial [Planctomycetota bacterium]
MFRNLALALLIGSTAAPALAQEAAELPPATEGQAQSQLINQLHQREWVRLDADGKIRGSVKILSAPGQTEARVGAKVVLSKSGEVVLETKTDSEGKFEVENVEPGTYALQVRGDVTRAAYALHVLPTSSNHLTSELEVFASVIPSDRAKELVSTNLAPEWDGTEDVYYRVHESDPIANERRFNDSHQVVLRNGHLVGRVSRPGWTFAEQNLAGSLAQIVREGRLVAQVPVNKEGYFVVK